MEASESVHWKRNCFKIPLGNAGKSFVKELSRLFNAFATASTMEATALKVTVVLPLLVLQKPHRNSKTQDHIRCLERQMKLWSEGSIDTLVVECRAIQKRLPKYGKKTRTKSTVKILCQFNVPGEDSGCPKSTFKQCPG